jgi:hypothetical protein
MDTGSVSNQAAKKEKLNCGSPEKYALYLLKQARGDLKTQAVSGHSTKKF